MDGREVHAEPRVSRQPRARERAAVDAEVVAQQVDERDRRWSQSVDQFEQLDKLDLSLPSPEYPNHPATPRVEGGEEIERTLAYVLVLDEDRLVRRPRRTIA
jgi:hypothetical protein